MKMGRKIGRRFKSKIMVLITCYGLLIAYHAPIGQRPGRRIHINCPYLGAYLSIYPPINGLLITYAPGLLCC